MKVNKLMLRYVLRLGCHVSLEEWWHWCSVDVAGWLNIFHSALPKPISKTSSEWNFIGMWPFGFIVLQHKGIHFATSLIDLHELTNSCSVCKGLLDKGWKWIEEILFAVKNNHAFAGLAETTYIHSSMFSFDCKNWLDLFRCSWWFLSPGRDNQGTSHPARMVMVYIYREIEILNNVWPYVKSTPKQQYIHSALGYIMY